MADFILRNHYHWYQTIEEPNALKGEEHSHDQETIDFWREPKTHEDADMTPQIENLYRVIKEANQFLIDNGHEGTSIQKELARIDKSNDELINLTENP